MKQTADPRVFVSYSWDSKPHKEKIEKFIHDLRSNGINVIHDEELSFGRRIADFIENCISKSDVVLFICTPNYKHRADNGINGVGYENKIITSELYENNNEEKFIPVLFAGTWETSLPAWARGKKGLDLSALESYHDNLPKLISHLQGGGPNPGRMQTGSAPQYMETESYLDAAAIAPSGSRPAKVWKTVSDVNTFRGQVLVAVVGGIIMLFISFISAFLPDPNDPAPNSATAGNTISNSADTGNTALGTAPQKKGNPDGRADRLEQLSASLDDSAPNGTAPKGSDPVAVEMTEETRGQLAFIQGLSIGCSKKWIDQALGPPFVEKTLPIKEGGLLLPFEDEAGKTGEILACVYTVPNIVMVQACFDIPDNSCQAFFVTLLDDVSGADIIMPAAYSPLVSRKPLGEFAFSEIEGGFMSAYGFTGQGAAHTFYGEEYYFAGAGNYYDFYFAVVEQGMLDSLPDFVRFLSIIQFFIRPMDDALPLPDAINRQREKFYPNTYGISALGSGLAFDFLCGYLWYDTLTFRNAD